MLLANIHNAIECANAVIALEQFYKHINYLAEKGNSYNKKIAFYGQPDQRTINIFANHGYEFVDLDINFNYPEQKIVPDVYCHIIRDIVSNAVYLKNEIDFIICTTGRDKCDQGRNVRDILSQMGFQLIDASNINTTPMRKPIVSQAKGNLKKRIIRIMELIYKPLTEKEEEYYTNSQCEPDFNFHGVPPQDVELLNLFPDETHIQGWTRLVEMGIPSKVDLEWEINNTAPTIYFSQSFCNKQLMAEYLSKKNNGLYVDGHGFVTGSMRAKLEAFIRLRNKKRHIMYYETPVQGVMQ